MFGLASIIQPIEYYDPQKQRHALVCHIRNLNILFEGTINQARFYIYNAVAENNDVHTY